MAITIKNKVNMRGKLNIGFSAGGDAPGSENNPIVLSNGVSQAGAYDPANSYDPGGDSDRQSDLWYIFTYDYGADPEPGNSWLTINVDGLTTSGWITQTDNIGGINGPESFTDNLKKYNMGWTDTQPFGGKMEASANGDWVYKLTVKETSTPYTIEVILQPEI